MEFRTFTESYDSGETFTLYPISDIHFGTVSCSKKRIFKVRQEIISNPNARWIGIGDYLEWIDYKDPRFNPAILDTTIFSVENLHKMGDVGVRYLRDFFKPIIDKCWGMSDGNHEDKFQLRNDTVVVERLLELLGEEYKDLYTQWTASTEVVFKDAAKHTCRLKIWSEHGWQAGRTQGATRNEMHKVPNEFPGHDIYLRGHSHHLFADPMTLVFRAPDTYKLYDKKVIVAHTGSYLESYHEGIVSYAEKAGYPPTALGGLKIQITPKRSSSPELTIIM